mmetsp:Transcript_39859/g.89322  ORF Transcript_39859/g.89322 Transcript_39859/m.89322 type:complete len:401 (+) Transcript_39859:136-1338(+)
MLPWISSLTTARQAPRSPLPATSTTRSSARGGCSTLLRGGSGAADAAAGALGEGELGSPARGSFRFWAWNSTKSRSPLRSRSATAMSASANPLASEPTRDQSDMESTPGGRGLLRSRRSRMCKSSPGSTVPEASKSEAPTQSSHSHSRSTARSPAHPGGHPSHAGSCSWAWLEEDEAEAATDPSARTSTPASTPSRAPASLSTDPRGGVGVGGVCRRVWFLAWPTWRHGQSTLLELAPDGLPTAPFVHRSRRASKAPSAPKPRWDAPTSDALLPTPAPAPPAASEDQLLPRLVAKLCWPCCRPPRSASARKAICVDQPPMSRAPTLRALSALSGGCCGCCSALAVAVAGAWVSGAERWGQRSRPSAAFTVSQSKCASWRPEMTRVQFPSPASPNELLCRA